MKIFVTPRLRAALAREQQFTNMFGALKALNTLFMQIVRAANLQPHAAVMAEFRT